MSLRNSVAPHGAETEMRPERPAFAIPDDLAARYQVRIVETPKESERRVGLFLVGDRTTPVLEIANERIVARKHDPETVATLVKLAKHNGWDSIAIEGAPEFRKSVWTAATRAGLIVNGYEPSFAEQETMVTQRRADTERHARDVAITAPVGLADTDKIRQPAAHEAPSAAADQLGAEHDAKSAVQSMRARSPERQTDPESQRVADAGLRNEKAGRRLESEELANLFLNGAADQIAADPRLAKALEAQAVMKLHIAEVFQGDATGTTAATRESRILISDVLRRGLDVSVREPVPERQIEPIKTLDMER
jgi:hypothetical protein